MLSLALKQPRLEFWTFAFELSWLSNIMLIHLEGDTSMCLHWQQCLLSWELKKIIFIKAWNPTAPFCVLGLFFQEMAIEHYKYQITICKRFAPWGLLLSSLWAMWIIFQDLGHVWAISLQYLTSMPSVKKGQEYFQVSYSLLFLHFFLFWVCVEWRK